MSSTNELAKGDLGAGFRIRAEPFMPTTDELVTAVRAGEKSAFAQLVQLYQRAAIITAHSVLRDPDRAQDAAQEAFVIAYTKLNQLHTPAAFGPWLLKIVRRRASLMQRERREEQLEPDIAVADSQQSSHWLYRYEEVIEQLARLPEHERTVVVLRYLNGHSVQEIADTIGKPVGTIKKQLSRALERLRRWLKEVPS
jgi:RNA polymerase sigma-70 factor (ECF subfamily)